MSYTYDQRKRPRGAQNKEPEQTAAPGPGMEALMSGRAAPTAAQKGQPFDLDAAMKAKMENAFGDLSAVKFYKSRAVGEAGAEAIAQGNEIAFAPGKADFSTKAGQERLGHELSHVMSQRSGQVRGSGFLNDSSLEARADREGAMAAAGQQVYGGPVTHALSGAVPSAFSAGTMQARRDVDRAERIGSSMLLDRDRQKLYENNRARKPKKIVSEKDELWFKNKMESGDEGFFKEIRKRRKAAQKRLTEHREAMGPGPNDQMLDYEASFSVPAQEVRLYDLMLGQGSEDTVSPLENTEEGAPVRNELLDPKLRYLLLRSAGWNKEANKLLSDAGKTYRLRNGGLPPKKRPGLIDEPRILNEEPRISLPDSGSLEDNLIREPATKSREAEMADRLFRIGAGTLYDSEEGELLRKEYIAKVMPKYLEKTRKDGSPNPEGRARVYAVADYRAHKPKQKLLTGSRDRKWYNNTLSNPS